MQNAKSERHGFVALPGARIAYESAGEGEPLVFLHGGLLDGRMWDDQLPFFAQRHHAIRYDMRGTGRSEIESSAELHIPYQDLAHFLQALDIPRASLVGLSGGARAAIDFAIAYPARVQRLVLVSPG